MSDPFLNVDDAGIEFARETAETMEIRQSEPIMERLVSNYLNELEFKNNSLSVEIGCGAGSISRRIAQHTGGSIVFGFDPSSNYIKMAQGHSKNFKDLNFSVADGKQIPLENRTADQVIFHTVLSHVVSPNILITEACRLLRKGGKVVICVADFTKATTESFSDHPLSIAPASFVNSHVTDPHLVGKIKPLPKDTGFKMENFNITSRVVTGNGMRMWIETAGKGMVERRKFGAGLADALIAEYDRRVQNNTLHGFLPLLTFIAKK